MEVAVDVRCASEVPHEVRSLDLPDVPDAVASDVEVAAEAGDEESIDHVLGFDGAHGDFDVIASEACEHASHGVQQVLFLIVRKISA